MKPLVALALCAFVSANALAQQSPSPKAQGATSTTPKQRQATQPPAPVTISGQVFVVTNGRQNIKLGLVNVSAHPIDETNKRVQFIADAERVIRAEALQRAADRQREIEQVNAENEALRSRYENASQRFRASSPRDPMRSTYEIEMVLAQEEYARSSPATGGMEAAKDEAFLAELRLRSIGHFLERLGSPTGSSKTDADGLFEISVPPGRYFITAVSSRMVGSDNNEIYAWALEVDASTSIKRMLLSNDNQWSPGCSACLRLPPLR